MRRCSIQDCDQLEYRRGWCTMHFTRWKRHGDPLFVKRIRDDDERRFWTKVQKTDACWLWTGRTNAQGYGRFDVKGIERPAHVYSYTLEYGSVPTGLELDHLCRQVSCVRPSHLEA